VPALDRDGVGVWYDPGTPNGRTPMLLTHGFGASADMWAPNLPALGAERQVITWDIRGHGRSGAPDEQARYSEGLSLDDMAAVLDACGAERAIVGGLSLGGYLSLAFHRRHPGRVAALMLFDTGPGYRRDEAREDWNRRVERTAAESPPGLALAARGIMAQHGPEVIDSLPAIAVPTLVLVGANDRPFLVAADYMAGKIPGAVKVVVRGAGHVANADRPREFDRAVLDFLRRLP
jgi:pimeloyl-ACP methyl ester carboxylesterase